MQPCSSTALQPALAYHSRSSDRLPSLRVNYTFADFHDSNPVGAVAVIVKEGPAVES